MYLLMYYVCEELCYVNRIYNVGEIISDDRVYARAKEHFTKLKARTYSAAQAEARDLAYEADAEAEKSIFDPMGLGERYDMGLPPRVEAEDDLGVLTEPTPKKTVKK